MFVTLFGILMLMSDLQPQKASFPIFVTLFGIFMLVRKLHKKKALSPITFTPFLIEYLPLKLIGALSNLFQSMLYFTPNSSSTAFSRSSSVTSVLHTSSSFGFCTFFSLGFCTPLSFGLFTSFLWVSVLSLPSASAPLFLWISVLPLPSASALRTV